MMLTFLQRPCSGTSATLFLKCDTTRVKFESFERVEKEVGLENLTSDQLGSLLDRLVTIGIYLHTPS